MSNNNVLRAVKIGIAAAFTALGIYICVTASDLSRFYTYFRVNSGFASQFALVIAVCTIIVSVIAMCGTASAGISYFASAAYLTLSVCCLCYYMTYSFYKDMIVFSLLYACGAIAFYALAKLTSRPGNEEAHEQEDSSTN